MKKTILTILIFAFLFFISALFSYFYRVYKRVVVTDSDVIKIGNEEPPPPTPTPDPLAPKNILILGYAGGDHEGATLTDTIIIAHLIPKEDKVTLVSIPRDIWVPIPTEIGKTEKEKINAAFAIGWDDKKYPNKAPQYQGLAGGGNLAKDSVGLVTGLKIDNYIAINFEGFKNIINILGGVDVNVPYTFEDKFYPIEGKEKDTCGKSEDEFRELEATLSGQLLEQEFICRFETLKFEKGKQTLDAETALKFVRSRHSEVYGGDFGRSLRQQALLVGIKNKILRIGSIPKIVPIINSVSKNIITDIDIKRAIELLTDEGSLKDIEVNTISLNTDNTLQESLTSDRQYILIPKDGEDNWNVIHQYLQKNLF